MIRLFFVVLLMLAAPVYAQDVRPRIGYARFDEPTDRYDHGILGDAIEYGALVLSVDLCPACAALSMDEITIRLPENRVFEDIAPRVVDLDYDQYPEVIVVETDLNLGAQLAIYGIDGKIAETPFLGQPHRWLAPIGAADFNNDGQMDIAYIEKPHLTKILKIWTFEKDSLRLIAEASGLTNHSIGQDYITGGIRVCHGIPEIITVSGDWQYIVATRLVGNDPTFTTLGVFDGPQSIAEIGGCP